MVAGLRNVSQKIKDMGAGEETHEPVENLELIDGCQLCVGQTVYLKSDGPEVTGEIFEVRRCAAPSMLARSALYLARLIPAVRLAAADGRADGPCWLEAWREATDDGYA